jgi:ParB-like chromosome segregation protein Spo0J
MIKCSYDKLVMLKQLKPHDKNPNKHSKEQIERLAKLIDYHGQRLPIIVSNLSGKIVAGHGRLEALKKLGWTECAVNYQDFESEEQEYAFVVSDNAIAKWAQLDLGDINKEFVEFGPEFDIELLGLKEFEIEPADKEQDDITKAISDDLNKKFIIEVTFPNDMEMMDIHDDLVSRGYIVRIKK